MKKVLLTIMMAMVGSFVMGGILTPSDQTKFNGKIKENKSPWEVCYAKCALAICAKENPKSFQSLTNEVRDLLKQEKQEVLTNSIVLKLVTWNRTSKPYEYNYLAKEGYVYSKANKLVIISVRYLEVCFQKKLMSEEALFDEATFWLENKKVINNPGLRKTAFDILKVTSINVKDENKVKSTLKRLNRFYTPYLLKDKAAFEPIVAEIRTVLETY